MEADSTTHDNNYKTSDDDITLPFTCDPRSLTLYKEFLSDKGNRNFETQLVIKLQNIGLLLSNVTCPTNGEDCKVVCRTARVIDRVQWLCEGCGKRLPIRIGSFFFKLQCSILQALQMIIAWSEDADINIAAQFFDVKLRTATLIYDKLDELAILELRNCKLGGDDSIVLMELYPDCMNRLSPDTTDQPHAHRILMLADTKHIPTYYRLHVIRDDLKQTGNNVDHDEVLKAEVARIVPDMVARGSTLVAGSTVPLVEGALPVQQLLQHCDADMQHFLTSRVWRGAVTLCAAAREAEAEAGAGAGAGAGAAQSYLDAALHRRRTPSYLEHALALLARAHAPGAPPGGALAHT